MVTPGHSTFYVVNQFTFLENRNNRRPDIILFINGLPLVLMKLKSLFSPKAFLLYYLAAI
ncbi:type I restriction endonuclease [Oribacterium asaccharolyticum]|nr:type I restriction endonuclease [Oribacterium asaccharolyticum]